MGLALIKRCSALEGVTYSQLVLHNLNAMHVIREAFIKNQNNKLTPKRGYSEQRQDQRTVPWYHGSNYVRVQTSTITHVISSE